MDVLQQRFEAAEAIYKMPDDFNDDSIQKHFQSDPAYAASIGQETDLLYRATAEPDSARARAMARQALALIDVRQRRWFSGAGARFKPYDDLFLTMEGFGQWAAYAWLSNPGGGGMTSAAAQAKSREPALVVAGGGARLVPGDRSLFAGLGAARVWQSPVDGDRNASPAIESPPASGLQ